MPQLGEIAGHENASLRVKLGVPFVEEDVGSLRDVLDPVGLAEPGGEDMPAGADARGDAGLVASVVEPGVFEGDGEGYGVVDQDAVGAVRVGGDSLEGQGFACISRV